MEEHKVDQDGGQSESGRDDDSINTALLAANRHDPGRRDKRCARGCSRATQCILTLPFLVIAGLVVVSVFCFYNVRYQVGGCVLFGVIAEEKKLFEPGPDAVCLTVTYAEMALGGFAILCAFVLVIKALLSCKMLTWFVLIELFILCLALMVSAGISCTKVIGIDDTCRSLDPKSATPNYQKCGSVEVYIRNTTEEKRPVWSTLLKESLIASWLSTLVYFLVAIIWLILSLFTCCAISSRRNHAATCQPHINTEGRPTVQHPNIAYGAT